MWIDSVRLDVAARAVGEQVIDADEPPRNAWVVVRALLEDRVRGIPEESRDRAACVLVRARGGGQPGPERRRTGRLVGGAGAARLDLCY